MHFPQKFCPWWTFFYFGFWFHGDLAFTHLHMESLWVFGTLLLMFEFSFISGLSHFRNDRPSGYPFVFSPHLFAFSVFTACDAFRFSISAFSVFTLESEVHTLFYIFLYIFSFSFPGLLFSFLSFFSAFAVYCVHGKRAALEFDDRTTPFQPAFILVFVFLSDPMRFRPPHPLGRRPPLRLRLAALVFSGSSSSPFSAARISFRSFVFSILIVLCLPKVLVPHSLPWKEAQLLLLFLAGGSQSVGQILMYRVSNGFASCLWKNNG